jgi:hypothetical protein
MSKKEKLKNVLQELNRINLDEKTHKFWKKTFKVYLDESCEHLISGKIAFLAKKHGLKNESNP